MSLEIALQENTAAIHALIAALSGSLPPEKAAKPEKKAPLVEEPVAEAAKETEAETKPPTRIETAEWVTKLVEAKGTAAAKAVLAQHNATHLNGIDPTEYAAVIDACQQALEA